MSKEKELQDELERYWGQLDRVERMLKWLVVRKELDYLSHDLEHNEYKKEYRKPILDNMFKLGKHLPDISDILEGK